MKPATATESLSVKRRAPTLYLIITIKLLKGVGLLLLALGIYNLSDNDLPADFNSLLHFLHFDPEKKFFTDLANKIRDVSPSAMVHLARGTSIYALFSLVEGVGLMFRWPWAGWLAIGESAFFIPIEFRELMIQPAHGKAFYVVLVILALNVFIVWYLFQNRKRLFRHHHHIHRRPPAQNIDVSAGKD